MIYDFGRLLKDLRRKRNLSQTQLADKLYLTKSTISGYENNVISPSLDIIRSLSVIFNTTTDYILGLDKREFIVIDELTERQRDILEKLVLEFKNSNKKSRQGF